MADSAEEIIAGLVRDAVFAARDRGATVYAASEDAAAAIMNRFPSLSGAAVGSEGSQS